MTLHGTGRKYPPRVNLGGLWIFNPPEPRGRVTNLDGIRNGLADPVAAGIANALPPAWEVTFKGPGRVLEDDPDAHFTWEQELVGRHLLIYKEVNILQARNEDTVLAWYETRERLEFRPLVPKWTLFYKSLSITRGPTTPAFGVTQHYSENWYLVSQYTDDPEAIDPDIEGEYALQIYEHVGPGADANSGYPIVTDFWPGDRRMFDPLGSNRFRVLQWHEADPEYVAVGGHAENIEVTVSPFYP